MRGKSVAAGGLAGLGAAELEHMPAGRRAAEVMIKGDDAVDFGAGDVQLFGDQRLGGFVDVAECSCNACRIGNSGPSRP